MSANWNNPTVTSAYASVISEFKDRDIDTAKLDFDDVPVGIPTGTIRYVTASNKFQRWSGAAWVDLLLSVAGGGTGSSTAAAARTALGLGTIATQDANNVTITGGSITLITTFTVNGNIGVNTDDSFDLASNAKKIRKGYFKTGLVIPVGADKWVTS